MRKFILTLILLSFSIMGFQLGVLGSPRFAKIGLALNQNEVMIPVNTGEQLFDFSGATVQAIPVPGDLALITWSGGLFFINDIPISPGPLVIVPAADLLSFNSKAYRGEFFISGQNGKIGLMNQLSIEDYLRGVVPREVIAGWPMAALKAQAIAARTYTIASLARHSNIGADLCATTHCQVYGGASDEHPRTDLAVAQTAGEVVTYNGKIISAFYHDSSGGYTEDSANIWSAAVPYLKPVADWDFKSRYSSWTRWFNWLDLQGLVARSYPQIGRLKQVLPLTFGKDGKILKLTLKGDTGEATLTGEQFRYLTGIPSSNMQLGVIYGPAPFITLWWMHGSPLPEALIADNEIPGLTADILNPPWDLNDPWSWLQDKEPFTLVIKGSGWGHGVGMSQEGARGMAEVGYNERQILGHFYPGTTISILGDSN